MTTDITELVQREKFEAWAEHACAAPWGYLKKRRTSAGYSEQIYTCMWTAWKAANAELVEALEQERRICSRWRKTAEAYSENLEKAQTINAAAEKLVRCKGRYHSEQNYRALAALFGLTTPDLPPLDGECRTVTVNLPESFKLAKSSSGLTYYYADEVDAALTAAGIKVEAE